MARATSITLPTEVRRETRSISAFRATVAIDSDSHTVFRDIYQVPTKTENNAEFVNRYK